MWLVIPLLFITSQRGTVILGIFRGDFGDFIPPRRPMQIMVPWSEWVTSTTGCMADLALCPFRFSRVKTVFFFWKGKYKFTVFHRRFHLGWLDSEAIRFFQGSSEILARVRRDNFTWGGLQVSFGARPYFSGEVLVSGRVIGSDLEIQHTPRFLTKPELRFPHPHLISISLQSKILWRIMFRWCWAKVEELLHDVNVISLNHTRLYVA